MRILVHDYAGHPFQVELSRALAARGHTVQHAYCASLVTTPQGALTPQPDDPATFGVRPLDLGEPLDKANLVKRRLQEGRYGKLAAVAVADFAPDVVLSGNTPLDAQQRMLRATHAAGAGFVFWVQDLIGLASARLLAGKVPVIGGLVGRYYANLELRLLAQSDRSVIITEDFRAELPPPARDRAVTIPNWAPLGDMPLRERDNGWAEAQGLDRGRLRFLYSGTLGLKHNPGLLASLAAHRPEADVVVVSQGTGADWLREQKAQRGLANLQLLPFQPFEALPEVLASADVLVAVLEPDAGVFSVPSKVLTYLCAGRALLLAVPPENLAARIVEEAGAGRVVPPTDSVPFLAAADALADAPDARAEAGRTGRAWAEAHFEIGAIADQFEAVLGNAVTAASQTPARA